MVKIKRSSEIVFILASVLGLLAAIFMVTGSQLTNAQTGSYPYPPYPYPYPEPTKPQCSRIDDPYIGPYPEACVYLPAVPSNIKSGATPTIILPPSPTPSPTPPPSPTPTLTPTNTPTPTATSASNPYP